MALPACHLPRLHNSRSPNRLIRIFLVVPCVLLTVYVGRAQEEETPTFQTFKDAWQLQSSEIQTAKIRLWHRNGIARNPASWGEVVRAVEQLSEKANSGDSDAVLTALIDCVESIANPVEPRRGTAMTIIVEGEKNVRNIIEVDDEKKIDLGFKGDSSIVYRSNFQEAHVEKGDSIDAKYRMPYIRPLLIPSENFKLLPDRQSDSWKLNWIENGVACTAAIDRATKLLTRLEIGEIKLKVRGGISQFSGGISIPTYGIDVSMGRDSRVRAFDAFVVKEAEFNFAISDADLAVIAPGGTHIFDMREPGVEKVAMTDEGGDVARLVETLPFRINPESQQTLADVPPISNLRSWFLVLNVGLLLLASFYAGARFRKQKQET